MLTSQTEEQLYQLVQDSLVAMTVPEERDLGAIWFDPRSRSLVIERYQIVQGLEVSDLQGRTLQRVDAVNAANMTLEALPTGVYLFRLRTTDGVVVRRLLVE